MADYGDIADAIAARFLGTTPPSDEPAIRLATADLPDGITLTPCFLVFEPDDEWEPLGGSYRRGTLTYSCRLVLPRSDEPRTQRSLMDWRTALYTRLDGYVHLGGTAGVAAARVSKTASGALEYGGESFPAVEVTVVIQISEAGTFVA